MPLPNDDIDGIRRCRDCGERKPIEEFHKSSRRPSGRGSYCQPCFNERSKAGYAKRVKAKLNREVRKTRVVPEGMRYCPDCDTDKPLAEFPRNRNDSTGSASYCKPCHNARGREVRQRLHGGSREYHLRRRYGIGQAEFEGLLLAQRGECAICGVPDPEHVDHDHATGAVRGVLCFNCNGGLGQFKDNIVTMRTAITYLEETSCQGVLVHPGVFRVLSRRRAFRPSRTS